VDWLPHRQRVAEFYASKWTQAAVAFVIIFNFFSVILEKEIDPYPAEHQRHRLVWLRIDDVCNMLFLVELLINLYGNYFWPFVNSGWNWLDLVIVVVGVISLARVDLGSLAQIKVLRAFRVLRLFKRVKSLNGILVGLVNAIPGVINAFLVMLIFMTIYAIVAVDLFRDFAYKGQYKTLQRYGEGDGQYGSYCGFRGELCANGTAPRGTTFEVENTIPAITPRGFYYGQEYYGTFSRALYTLFQVLTGESWSEAVVRPLIFGFDAKNAFVVGAFFVTYILLTQVVLQNVVVAVLLETYVPDPDAEEQKKREAKEREAKEQQAKDEMLQAQQEKMLSLIKGRTSMDFDHAPQLPPGATQISSTSGKGPPWRVDGLGADESDQDALIRRLLFEQEQMKAQLAEVLSLLRKDHRLAA